MPFVRVFLKFLQGIKKGKKLMTVKTAAHLKQLLSGKKFLPIYIERKNIDKTSLSPVAVELHWTSICNYNCIHCSYGSRRQLKNKLSEDVIESVIDDLIQLNTRSVYLSGGGEPTTVKGWDRYAQRLMNQGVEVALITNGTALQESHVDILRRMNYIAISIYSTDEAEYEQITGSRFFEKQLKAPSIIKHGSNCAIVGARCVLNSINYRRIISIYQQAVSANFDYIIFIPAVDYEGIGVGLKLEEMDTLKRILKKHYNLFDFSKTNIDELIKRNINHYDESDYRKVYESSDAAICKAIEIRGNAFINYDGGVYLCQPHIGNKKYCIGNVNENSFKEIWNSKQHLKVIDFLQDEFAAGLCRNCRSVKFNMAAYEYDSNPYPILGISEDTFI